MAYINASARNYQIQIEIPGGTSLDVTQACSGESSGYLAINEPEPDESGVLPVTGKLILQVSDRYLDGNNFPLWSDNSLTGRDVFDPDLNPTRWAIGNYIIISFANETGSLVPFARNYLRILRTPLPPYPGNWQLEVEIGDDLALLNWRSPDGDGSGVTRGTASTVGSIVRSVLRQAGFQDSAGYNADVDTVEISGSINYNTPKQGGSWVDQAGRLAFAAGSVLWQNNQQEILAKAIDLDPAAPLLTVTLGQDEVDFKPIRGSERPCSVVRVAGVGSKIQDRIESGSSTNEERSVKAAVPELNGAGEVVNANDSTEILIRQTIETWGWDASYTTYTRTKDIYEARGLAASDQLYFDLGMTQEGGTYGLVLAERQIQRSIYGENATAEEGFLVTEEEELWQVNGKALADYYRGLFARGGFSLPTTLLELIQISTTTRTRSHIGTQIRKIQGSTSARIGAIAGSSPDWSDTSITIPDGFDYSVSGTTYQEWKEVNPQEWEFTDRESAAGQVQGSIAVMLALSQIKNQTTTSTAGQNDPPAAEVRPPRYVRVETELRGETNFEPLTGENYAPRERTYQIDYVSSSAQCENLAEILGTFLYGRHQAIELTLPLTDDWLSYEPLSRIDVVNGSTTLTGLTSGVSWVLAASQAIVTCTLLKLGKVESGEIVKPYRIPARINASIAFTATGNYSVVLTAPSSVNASIAFTATGDYSVVLTTDTNKNASIAFTATGDYSIVLTAAAVDASIAFTATGDYAIILSRKIDAVIALTATGDYAIVLTGGGVAPETETTTYINRVTADGGTVADSNHVNDLIAAIKAQGVWSDLVAAYSASGGYRTVSGNVDKLYNFKGATGDADQGTPSSRPAYQATGGANSKPAVSFNGHLLSTSLTTPSSVNHTVIAVWQHGAGNSSYRGIWATSGMMMLASDNGPWGTYGSTDRPASTTLSSGTNYILEMARATSDGAFYINGVADGTYADTTGQSPSHIGGTSGQSSVGKLMALFAFQVELNSTQRSAIRSILTSYYSI